MGFVGSIICIFILLGSWLENLALGDSRRPSKCNLRNQSTTALRDVAKKCEEEGRKSENTCDEKLQVCLPKSLVDHMYIPRKKGVSRYSHACQKLIQKSGRLGSWGTSLVSAMDRIAPDCFYQDIDTSNVCPNFNSLTLNQKKAFWVWVFTAIAMKESSCDETAQAPGVNGLADGLFQLEYSRDLRRGAGRDRTFCVTDRPVDTQSRTFQIECSLSIVRDTRCKVNEGRGEKRKKKLSSPGGYWLRLNGSNREISREITKFPGCK